MFQFKLTADSATIIGFSFLRSLELKRVPNCTVVSSVQQLQQQQQQQQFIHRQVTHPLGFAADVQLLYYSAYIYGAFDCVTPLLVDAGSFITLLHR